MSSISDLNLVVQQGGNAKEAHNTRPVVHDNSQLAAALQEKQEAEKRTKVQHTKDSDQVSLNAKEHKQKKDGRKRRRKRKQAHHQKHPLDPRAPGRLLDTIA